jgi:CBS domain-containing protein
MKLWRVDDVMTTTVVSVREDTPYRDVVDLLIDWRISAVPVVTADGDVVGVVSETDLIHNVEAAGERPRILPSPRRRGHRVKAAARTAAEAMTSPAATVRPSLSLAAAARRMSDERVEFRSTGENLLRLTREVPGVVGVADDLRYDVDDSMLTGSTLGTPFGVA